MKNKYLLLISVFFCAISISKGQHDQVYELPSDYSHLFKDSDIHAQQQKFTGISKEDIIWYEDFDGSLPATWEVVDNNDFCTFHHTYDGPQGHYSAGIGPLQSTTSHNGFMILDSDLCNSSPGFWPDTVNAFLQTPGIDLSDHPNVLLSFEHSFRYLYSFEHSLLQVLVSNDSINWVSYDVRNNIQPNHMSPNPLYQMVNISDVAGGEESVWIRFHKVNATYYYWMLDDVSLIEFDESELSIKSVKHGGYSLIPGGQQSPAYLSANVINEGSMPVSDVELKVDINDFFFNESTAISEIGPGEEVEIIIDEPFTPGGKGKYNIVFSLWHESFNNEPVKTSYETSVWVTDTVYSRDDNIYSEGISAEAGEPFIIGNRFDIFSSVEATSVGFVLYHQTEPGAQIKALIYEITDDGFLVIAETGEYTLTDSDIPEDYMYDPVSVVLPFTEHLVLEPDNQYLAAVEYGGGDDIVVIAGSTGIEQPADASYTYADGVWQSEDVTPLVRLCFGNNEADSEILLKFTTEDAYCGEANGSATVYPLTGTPPFSYAWDTEPVQTSQTATDLPEGTYQVTVTDYYGYEATGTVIIYDLGGTMPLVEYEIVNPEGCGESNGAIYIHPLDPEAEYDYFWSTGHTTQNIENISAGTYMLTITDQIDNCQLELTFFVNDSDAPEIIADITNVSCYGYSDGAIDITLEGEIYDPSYMWSTGETSSTIENLKAGIYSLTVTDSGCMAMDEFEVTQPDKLFISFDVTEPLCHGEKTGEISAVVSGGTSPYNYYWSTGATGETTTNIAAGKYFITVTDVNTCKIKDSVVVNEPTDIIIEADTIIHPTTGENNGAIYLAVTGGTGNYEYQWKHGPTTKDITGLPAGTYTVTIIDENGCMETKTFILEEVYVNNILSGAEIVVYPNPANDYTIIEFKAPLGATNIYLKDMYGKRVFEDKITVTDKNRSYLLNTHGFKPGVYIIIISTLDGIASLQLIIS